MQDRSIQSVSPPHDEAARWSAGKAISAEWLTDLALTLATLAILVYPW